MLAHDRLFAYSWLKILLAVGLITPLASVHAVQQSPVVIHVIPDGSTESACGASWANGCDLQFVLQTLASPTNHDPVEIWVKEGTYYPTTDPQDRSAAFALVNNASLYGGFAGDGTEQSNKDRDWLRYPTILSGDIDHEDPALVDLASPVTDPTQIRGSNAYHVVVSQGTDSSSIMDGFIITAGQAVGQPITEPYDNRGGGMYNAGSPTLKNLIFTGNTSSFLAGGIWNDWSNSTITDVTFQNNSAGYAGGGMANSYSRPILINNTFSENIALDEFGDGAGLYNFSSSPILINSTFYGNHAYTGAGVYNRDESKPVLIHVSMVNNTASGLGGAVLNDQTSSTTIRNSILWGNVPDQLFESTAGSSSVTYSVAQNGYPGTGNINENPRIGPFANYGGVTKNISLLPGSPAINKIPFEQCTNYDGSRIANDQRGMPRPQASLCDMGAYEFVFPYHINFPVIQK